jgi:hypothetical protein
MELGYVRGMRTLAIATVMYFCDWPFAELLVFILLPPAKGVYSEIAIVRHMSAFPPIATG